MNDYSKYIKVFGSIEPYFNVRWARILSYPIKFRPNGMSREQYKQAEKSLILIHGADMKKIFNIIISDFKYEKEEKQRKRAVEVKLFLNIAPNPYKNQPI
jgi:hypothetical protein